MCASYYPCSCPGSHFLPLALYLSVSAPPLPRLQTTGRCVSGRTLPTRRTQRWWRHGRAFPTCCPLPEVSPPPALTVKINALFYYLPPPPSTHPYSTSCSNSPTHLLFTPSQSHFHTAPPTEQPGRLGACYVFLSFIIFIETSSLKSLTFNCRSFFEQKVIKVLNGFQVKSKNFGTLTGKMKSKSLCFIFSSMGE